METQKLDFDFFYAIYKKGVWDLYKIEKKYPDDSSKYWGVCQYYQREIEKICHQLYKEKILSNPDFSFFEQALLENMEKEELVMLDILSEFIWEFQDRISTNNYFFLLHRCLDILEKNGTDMVANYIPAYLYERLIDVCGGMNVEESFVLFKRIISLSDTERWHDVPARYSIYFKTAEFLREEKAYFDVLLTVLRKNEQDIPMKRFFESHLQQFFINKGLSDENYNWIEK